MPGETVENGVHMHCAAGFGEEDDERKTRSVPLTPFYPRETSALEGPMQLERRWMLWHEFMKDYSCLDDWLRLAENCAASPNTSHVLYVAASEELKKFETLQTDARGHLSQLDSLVRRNRSLVPLFTGAMRSRLVAMTRNCSQRWDCLMATIESVCRRLKHFVSQWEDFDRRREEMSVWLADMDLRLTEVEHFSGSDTGAKMRQLQSFQKAVCDSAGRLNALLEQGEALIQRSEPADAQKVETQLQELLLCCAHVFEGVGRLHTRLLSMRLVFEEDWILPTFPDSGCPSETPLPEDEGVFDGTCTHDEQSLLSTSAADHQLLEWDPSVDIGGSTRDDADSSYYSAAAGACQPEEPARKKSHLTPAESRVQNTSSPAETGSRSRCELWASDALSSHPPASGTEPCRSEHLAPWKSSTPKERCPEPVTFDPERISAWLGQTHQHASASRSTAVPQYSPSGERDKWPSDVCSQRHACHPHRGEICATPHPTWSRGAQLRSSWTHHARHSGEKCLGEGHGNTDKGEASICINPCSPCWPEDPPTRRSPWPVRMREFLRASVLLSILLALLMALLAWPPAGNPEVQCHRANALARSFHLVLHYVNGPPPT
ncbi:nesprin-2 isoform X2 [Denticeps clupeoides]|uniref:nesprin-2 isoform X2 n=1 Tax=Denticeps clupeoides TaxID=299321 RepID=UPI0010A2E7F2|nr:nesprin-2-like isoform X2 [Denticeps clupeoides]